jgi:hypothetical protein
MRRLHFSSLLITASLFAAGACSGSAATSSSGSALPSSETTAETDTDAETQRLGAAVIGIGDYPRYTVKASAGWSSNGHFVTSKPGVIGIGVWVVSKVPRDPCHWKGQLRDPGPSTDDLVGALRDQKYSQAGAPGKITLAGYPATYLVLTVPEDRAVTGNGDFQGCDDAGNNKRDFVRWFGNGFGVRYEQVAGQVDRLWILDMNGQRLVVDATYSPDTAKAAREELSRVVESIRFADTPG